MKKKYPLISFFILNIKLGSAKEYYAALKTKGRKMLKAELNELANNAIVADMSHHKERVMFFAMAEFLGIIKKPKKNLHK